MSEKMSKDELLSQIELMRENLAEFSGMMMKFAHKPKNYPEILKKASEVREQAICQLKQLLEAQAEPSEEFVKEQAARFMLRCPGFPPAQLDRLEDFIRNLIQERPRKILVTHDYNAGIARGKEEAEKPKVSREEWKKFSKEYDGEMLDDYYRGADCLFEWLEIKGMEVEE